MRPHSAGILLYKFIDGDLRLLLAHPGGPFWTNKDEGAWSIPKGQIEGDEHPLEAAKREFREETGFAVDGRFIPLGALKQPSGKIVHAWALEQDLDVNRLVSNRFQLEWPRRSGQIREFPEIDKVRWFNVEEARNKILKGQTGFIDALLTLLGRKGIALD